MSDWEKDAARETGRGHASGRDISRRFARQADLYGFVLDVVPLPW